MPENDTAALGAVLCPTEHLYDAIACPYEPGTYAADRWAHHAAAQACGLDKPLTRIDDYGTGQTDAATRARLKAAGLKIPSSKRAPAAGEIIGELRLLERRYGMLLFITINHPIGLDARVITDGRGTDWGKAITARLCPEGYARIEYASRSTGLHLHGFIPFVLMDLDVLAQLEAEGHDIKVRPANLSRDAMYCTKSPYDWTAITDKHRHVDFAGCLKANRAYLDGLEDYQIRTGNTQPPAGQWWFSGWPSSRGLAPVLDHDKLLTPPHIDFNPTPDEYTDDDTVYLAWLDEMQDHDERQLGAPEAQRRVILPRPARWTALLTCRLRPRRGVQGMNRQMRRAWARQQDNRSKRCVLFAIAKNTILKEVAA